MMTLDTLRRYDADGLITVRSSGDLIIANYTPKCQYSGAWDATTTICRGLILRVDQPWSDSQMITEVVAVPFPKFFNVGEGDRYPTGRLVNATEKMDGSLGILYRVGDTFRIATRGSFESDQARWATEFLQRFELAGLPENLTLLFEIIYPDGRVVVDYGNREDLVLIGVIDRFTHVDYPHDRLLRIGRCYDFTVVPTVNVQSVDNALRWAKALGPDSEGWVLRFDDGSRWKVKGDAYRQLHRIINNVTPKQLIEAMIAGNADYWLDAIPEEYRAQVDEWYAKATYYCWNENVRLKALCESAPKTTRKDFALWAKAEHPEDMPLLFSLLDEKDIHVPLLKRFLEVT